MEQGGYSDKLAIAANRNIKEREYWLKRLSGNLVKTSFPYDKRQNALNEYRYNSLTFTFSEDIFRSLMKISDGAPHTIHVILVAGLVVLLNKYTGNKDIIVGSPIYKQDFEGEFINTVLIIRNQLRDNIIFKELLLEVRNTIIEATNNLNYPIEALLYQLNIPYSSDGFPLFDVFILLENIHDKRYITHIHTNLIFSFSLRKDHIEGVLEYNSLLYEKATIERIGKHFSYLLKNLLSNVDQELSNLNLLSEEEKRQLLYEFKSKEVELPKVKIMHQWIELQAKEKPDKIASVFQDQQVTYNELNKRANRLAWLLRDKGVELNSIVGVMMDRSSDMVIAILAILKVGGAYIPLEPEMPQDRIATILKDSQAAIVLTSSTTMESYSLWDLQSFKSIRVNPVLGPPRPQITEFDKIPLPYRSAVDYEKYNQYIGLAMVKDSMSLQATRGCPYHCAYCHKIWPKHHVYRSAEHIFSEVQLLYDMGVRRFIIIDDIFNFNRKNSAKFFELLIKHNLDVQLFFPNGVRGDILTTDYIDLMVEAGATSVGMALETASPRLQKLIRKNLNLDKLRENLDYFCTKHPHVILELFTMHGFPTETEEEAMQTFEFVRNIKWIHFPYIEILKIYPNTDMEELALNNGISMRSILCSEKLAFHELPDTLPFDKNFTRKYQSTVLNEYFLLKERLLAVLPQQMRVLTESEIVQKYNSYLPTPIDSFSDILDFAGLDENELEITGFPREDYMFVPDLNKKLASCFPKTPVEGNELKIFLLDLSQSFSYDDHQLMDMIEPPLGLMYLMSYLNSQFGARVNCTIAKSMIDFDSYEELQTLLNEFKPDVIGIRTLTYYKNFFHNIIAMIRRWGYDIPIVAGGPYATSDYFMALQDRNIDLVVLGEGEITFAEVIQEILANGKKLPGEEILKTIPGIVFVPRRNRAETISDWSLLMLDVISDDLARKPCENMELSNRPEDLSYVIFTSGSTGKPKGAMLEHLGMMNHIQAKIMDLQLTEDCVVAQNAASSFDISIWQFFAALTIGGKIVIYPKELVINPQQFIEQLIKDRITILEVVPSYLSLLLEILDSEPQSLGSLKYLLVTGETVKPALVQRWFERYPAVSMVNAYGPTEASDDITHHIMDKAPEIERIPIGKPLQNLRIYIVDEHMNLCPIGIIGEICVTGIGVGRGYLNNIESTTIAFLLEPSSNGKGMRLYRTGDLGRWLSDGSVEFFGRKDYQVKIRGYRIELAEIENTLSSYPDISEVVVIDNEDDKGNKYLSAYMVTNKKCHLQSVKDYLVESLPDYMVPAFFMELDKIPLTENGKIDRKKLQELNVEVMEYEYTPPTNELEEKLVTIWQEVLKRDKIDISIDANFFDLGGNSLNSALMVTKIHKELGVKVNLIKVFEKQTIKELASYIKGLSGSKFTGIQKAEMKSYYPLSSVQKRLYILLQMESNNLSYNEPAVVVLEGAIDNKKFENTVRKLIDRHEIFRTSFEMVHGQVFQKIHEIVEFSIQYADSDEEKARGLINSFMRPFDLTRPPLLRISLVRIGQGRHILMAAMHHIIADRTSVAIFLTEFASLYRGDALPKLQIQYKDYAVWQNSDHIKGEIKIQEGYWLKQFEGQLPSMNLPLDYERPALQSFEGDIIDFELDTDRTEMLRRLASEEDVTTFMVLLALYNVFLAKLCHQEDIVIGTSTAGRVHADLEHIIGMFINTIPLRNYPEGHKTFRNFLREVKTRTLEAFENQLYQFDDLVEGLGIKRDTSRNPLFDVEFSYQNVKLPRVSVSDLRLKPYPYKLKTSQFDMTLVGMESRDRISLSINYKTMLFERRTIELFIKYFKEIISSVLSAPGKRLSEIEVTSKMEQKEILSDFNVDLEEE